MGWGGQKTKGEADQRRGRVNENGGSGGGGNEEQSQEAEDDEGRANTNRRSIRNWRAAAGRGFYTLKNHVVPPTLNTSGKPPPLLCTVTFILHAEFFLQSTFISSFSFSFLI